jgi:neutral ceramidase
MPRVLLLLLVTVASLHAAETPWKIGLASARITPDEPTLMYGYANRTTPHQGVASELFAKALALQDDAGHRAVLVTCDLGGVHGDMIDRIAARLRDKHGVRRDAVICNASHTHSGPMAWIAEDELKGLAAPAVAATRRYVDKLERTLFDVADEALSKLQPASLSWGLGMAPFVMNRRQFTDRGIILGFNPKGPVDRSVLVLRVNDSAGDLRAVVMGVACHCTCGGSKNFQIDGDYAGHAQAGLQAQFPGAQAMFITGCGGDANPWPRGELEGARKHGATLASEVARVLGEKLAPINPPLRTAMEIVPLPVAAPAPRAELHKMKQSSSSWEKYIGGRQLEILDRGQKPVTHFPMPIALWQFGSDFTLVGLSGEPVNDYVHLIENAIGPLRLWVAGYCNDVFGYVPSARIIAEGGYESRGIDRGDAVGQFSPEAELAIVGAVKNLATKAGRAK